MNTTQLKDIMSLKVLDSVITPHGKGQVRNIGDKVQVQLADRAFNPEPRWYPFDQIRKDD